MDIDGDGDVDWVATLDGSSKVATPFRSTSSGAVKVHDHVHVHVWFAIKVLRFGLERVRVTAERRQTEAYGGLAESGEPRAE